MNNIIKQAKLPLPDQHILLVKQFYSQISSDENFPNTVLEQVLFINDYFADYLFYPIPGYPMARINKNGCVVDIYKNRICEIQYTNEYCTVTLYNIEKAKCITVHVHRLLGLAFLVHDISCTKLDINHKDGNKHNFSLDNLEWCTRSENVVHALKNNLMYSEPIIVQDGDTTTTYHSIEEASRKTRLSASYIHLLLNFSNKNTTKYKFTYKNKRTTPKDFGIVKLSSNRFCNSDGIMLNIFSMSDLYKEYPEVTRPNRTTIRVEYTVIAPDGVISIYNSLRQLEKDIGISRKYIKKWMKSSNGSIYYNKYKILHGQYKQ